MEIIIDKNRMFTKTVIKKEELKNMIANVKTSYKKYMTNFVEESFNTTFGGMTLMSYYLMLKNKLFMSNPNIWYDLDITNDEENYYVRIVFKQFYDRDLSGKTTEQLQFMYNNVFYDYEKEVLNNFVQDIPDEQFIKEKMNIFIDLMFNVDDIIKEFKEEVKSAKEEGLPIKNNLKEDILNRIFGSYIIYYKKDTMNTDKEFLEKYYGESKE